MNRAVYVVGGDPSVLKMFRGKGWIALDYHERYNLSPDLVCFTGGADISPSLYGEENISSHCDPIRDQIEVEIYEEFAGLVPMVGICRGGQLLNVMNGGTMIQHIDGHSMGKYPVDFYADQNTHLLHEDHHQGMVPNTDTNYLVLGVDQRDGNYEILYYPESDCLCFQAHPEWGDETTKELFFGLIEEYQFF